MDEWRTAVNRFAGFHGDRITASMVRGYRRTCAGLPPRARKGITCLPLREQVEAAEAEGPKALAPATVNKALSATCVMLDHAVEELEVMGGNVAKTVRSLPKDELDDPRLLFEPGDMRTIHSAPLPVKDGVSVQPLFWVLLLAPFTGCRLEELGKDSTWRRMRVRSASRRSSTPYARRPAQTRALCKVGDLAGFASALVLAMIALGIGAESVQRLFAPSRIAYAEATGIALLGHGHDHDHGHEHHGHTHDNNLRSAHFHVVADALTSVLAITALLAGRHLDRDWMDATVGVVGAVMIARWSWGLLRDTGAVLVDPALEAEIREAIEDGDACVTDLHAWRVGSCKYAVIIARVAAEPLRPDDYTARIRVHEELVHITVEAHKCERGHKSHLRAA